MSSEINLYCSEIVVCREAIKPNYYLKALRAEYSQLHRRGFNNFSLKIILNKKTLLMGSEINLYCSEIVVRREGIKPNY